MAAAGLAAGLKSIVFRQQDGDKPLQMKISLVLTQCWTDSEFFLLGLHGLGGHIGATYRTVWKSERQPRNKERGTEFAKTSPAIETPSGGTPEPAEAALGSGDNQRQRGSHA